jgi:ABC-type Fe3+/spermidine/putrescine transport system ATPase subunit
VHVTHDREEAMVLADRIVVLRDGKIEQEGAPEEVYHRPATPYVASFMGADNIIRLRIRPTGDDIEAAVPDADVPFGVRLATGSDGVHMSEASLRGDVDAHFRAEAVGLAAETSAVPEQSLALPGAVTQMSYPGGIWRYHVQSGTRHFIIDDETRYAVGDKVRIVLPAKALHLFPAA